MRIHTVRRIVGVAVGILALYLSCRGLRFDEFRSVFARGDWVSIGTALASVVLTVAAVAVRWRAILGLADVRPSWRTVVAAVFVGQAGNIVFPLRSGEFARAYIVSLHARRPMTQVLGTVVVERIADVLVAGVLVGLLLSAGRIPVPVAVSRFALGGLALAALIGLAALFTRSRAGNRLRVAFEPTFACLSQLRRWKVAVTLLAMTLTTFAFAASTNYLLFRVFGLAVPALAALVLLIALQVGTAVVSVPGNLGIFQYVTSLVLVAYGVDQQLALAYAWTLYLCTVVPRVTIGVALLVTGYSWPRA